MLKKMDNLEKRKRAVNFTPREQNLLFSIAVKYSEKIENKQTNAVSNSEKNEAWTRISNEFKATSQDFNNRSIDQLKRFYENRRSALKKKKAEVRQEYLKTGGGPPPQKDSEADQLILSTLDPLIVEGHYNPNDSDSVNFIGNKPLMLSNIEYILEDGPDESEQHHQQHLDLIEEVGKGSEQENVEPVDWKKKSVQKPLNPSLKNPHVTATDESKRKPVKRGCSSRRRPTATLVRTLTSSTLQQKYHELADKKNILSDHAIKKIEKERLFIEEEHKLKMRNLELDIEIKTKKFKSSIL